MQTTEHALLPDELGEAVIETLEPLPVPVAATTPVPTTVPPPHSPVG